jgi:Ca2+-binding EF-hand superfamily protein
MDEAALNIPKVDTLPASEVVKDFEALDINKDGEISAIEFIDGLRSNEELAKKFGLSSDILSEFGDRKAYEVRFGSMDTNSTKSVDVSDFKDASRCTTCIKNRMV